MNETESDLQRNVTIIKRKDGGDNHRSVIKGSPEWPLL